MGMGMGMGIEPFRSSKYCSKYWVFGMGMGMGMGIERFRSSKYWVFCYNCTVWLMPIYSFGTPTISKLD